MFVSAPVDAAVNKVADVVFEGVVDERFSLSDFVFGGEGLDGEDAPDGACWEEALAEAKRVVGSSRLAWTSLMVEGDLALMRRAEGEEGFRVTARTVKGSEEDRGWERRASMTAEPCLPVAPVMRRVRGGMLTV